MTLTYFNERARRPKRRSLLRFSAASEFVKKQTKCVIFLTLIFFEALHYLVSEWFISDLITVHQTATLLPKILQILGRSHLRHEGQLQGHSQLYRRRRYQTLIATSVTPRAIHSLTSENFSSRGITKSVQYFYSTVREKQKVQRVKNPHLFVARPGSWVLETGSVSLIGST